MRAPVGEAVDAHLDPVALGVSGCDGLRRVEHEVDHDLRDARPAHLGHHAVLERADDAGAGLRLDRRHSQRAADDVRELDHGARAVARDAAEFAHDLVDLPHRGRRLVEQRHGLGDPALSQTFAHHRQREGHEGGGVVDLVRDPRRHAPQGGQPVGRDQPAARLLALALCVDQRRDVLQHRHDERLALHPHGTRARDHPRDGAIFPAVEAAVEGHVVATTGALEIGRELGARLGHEVVDAHVHELFERPSVLRHGGVVRSHELAVGLHDDDGHPGVLEERSELRAHSPCARQLFPHHATGMVAQVSAMGRGPWLARPAALAARPTLREPRRSGTARAASASSRRARRGECRSLPRAVSARPRPRIA